MSNKSIFSQEQLDRIAKEKKWIRKFLKPGCKVEIDLPSGDVTLTYKKESISFTEIGDDMSHISISYTNGEETKGIKRK